MQNLQITISPQQLVYNSQNRPLQILFKYKRIIMTTDYQLQKYQAKSMLPLRNNILKDIPSHCQYRDVAVIKFAMCKQMQMLNTKIQIIMIGCDKSEVNLLGICQIDLGTLADNNCALTVPKQTNLILKLCKCDDENAKLKVNVNFTALKKYEHKKHGSDHRNNKTTRNNNTIETQGYKKEQSLLNRRKNKQVPTAYEISHRNYKHIQISREYNETSSQKINKKSTGSYKKRFQYNYQNIQKENGTEVKVVQSIKYEQKRQRTPSNSNNIVRNRIGGPRDAQTTKSPLPRLKTPEPLRQSPQHTLYKQKNNLKRKDDNSNSVHTVSCHNNGMNQEKSANKVTKSQIVPTTHKKRLEIGDQQIFDHGNNIHDRNRQVSPSSQHINKFQMITQKLKQIQKKIIGKKNQSGKTNKGEEQVNQGQGISNFDQDNVDQAPRKLKSPYKQKNQVFSPDNTQQQIDKPYSTNQNNSPNTHTTKQNNYYDNNNDTHHIKSFQVPSSIESKRERKENDHKYVNSKDKQPGQLYSRSNKKQQKQQNHSSNVDKIRKFQKNSEEFSQSSDPDSQVEHYSPEDSSKIININEGGQNSWNKDKNDGKQKGKNQFVYESDSIPIMGIVKKSPILDKQKSDVNDSAQNVDGKNKVENENQNKSNKQKSQRQKSDKQSNKQKSNKQKSNKQKSNKQKSNKQKSQRQKGNTQKTSKIQQQQQKSNKIQQQQQKNVKKRSQQEKKTQKNLPFTKNPSFPSYKQQLGSESHLEQQLKPYNQSKELSQGQNSQEAAQTKQKNKDKKIEQNFNKENEQNFNKEQYQKQIKQKLQKENKSKLQEENKKIEKALKQKYQQIMKQQKERYQKQYQELMNKQKEKYQEKYKQNIQEKEKEREKQKKNEKEKEKEKEIERESEKQKEKTWQRKYQQLKKQQQSKQKQYEDKVSSYQLYIDEQEQNHRKILMQQQLQSRNASKSKDEQVKQYSAQIQNYRDQNIKQKQLIDKLRTLYEGTDDQHFQQMKQYEKKCLEYQRKLKEDEKKIANLIQQLDIQQSETDQIKKELSQALNSLKNTQQQPKSQQQQQSQQQQNSQNNQNNQNRQPNDNIMLERFQNIQRQKKLLEQKLKLSQQLQINLQNKIRIRQNQQRFTKIQIDNLKLEKKDLEDQIDMIAQNNKYQLGRKSSINKMNLESKSLFKGIKNQNQVLKGEVNTLKDQIRELNGLLEIIIKKDVDYKTKIGALEGIDKGMLRNLKQDYSVLAQKFQVLEQKVAVYEDQVKSKQNKIADILNIIWKHGDNQLMDQVDTLLGYESETS